MQARIADLCDVVIGRTPRRERLEYWGGTTPWVSIRDLNGGTINTTRECISDLAVREVMPRPVPAGTLLFSFKLTIGKTGLAARPLYTNEAIAALPIKRPDLITVSYLKYALEAVSAADDANHAVLGKVLNKEKVGDLRIKLPPLDEQQRIVDILDRAASIQRLRQAADEKLKQIIPALFVDMFGDPATNPKGWPMTTVGDLIESADYGSSSKAHDEATGLPMLRMGNVTMDGSLDLRNLKYVELDPTEQAKFTLKKGDILFNRTNSKELVGKTGIWDGSCEAVYASYFIRLRTKPDLMAPEVLWAFMNSKHTKGMLFGMARGAIGQSNINSKELKAIRLFAPPIALQQRFSQLYYDLKAKAAMSAAATTAATSIADSLANEVFSAA